MVRLRRLSRRMSSGGRRRVPSPPPRSLPSSTLFSVPGEEEEEAPVGRQDPRRSRVGQRLVRPAEVTGHPRERLVPEPTMQGR